MKTAEKIVNNLINENIFPLKVSSLRQDVRWCNSNNKIAIYWTQDPSAWEVEPEKRQLHRDQRSQIQNSFALHTYSLSGTYL